MPPSRRTHLRLVGRDAPEVLQQKVPCHLCGTPIEETEAFFQVHLEVASGVNKRLPPAPPPTELKHQITNLLARIAQKNAKRLEEEVFLQRDFRVCSPCRIRLLDLLKCR
ncbi:MAG: hypothetical protein WA705_18030 [Candidatus Ozemobacteraceae bacterium]